MTELKQILKGIGDTIQVLLAEQPAPAPVAPAQPEQPANFSDYLLQDGTPIQVESLEPGKVVMINGMPAPAGEHILSDGTKIELDGNGVIIEIEAPQPEEVAAPVEQAAPQFDADTFKAELEANFSAQIAELKQTVEKQNQVINQIFEAMKQMADLPVAAPPAQPAQAFDSVEDKREAFAKFMKQFRKN